MITKRRFLSRIKIEPFLIGILCLIGLIPCPKPVKKRGRPYVYSPTVMLRCFIVRIWLRIPSNNALHAYFSIDNVYNKKVMKVCGLDRLPDRRTFDRRFRIISFDIKSRIDAMGILFVKSRLVDTYSASTVSVDSSLLRAKGHVWHRSSMRKHVVPYSGIDTDARWGYSKTKGWVFGYKLHLASSAGSLVVPLSADFTTANIPDNKMYESITSSIPEGIRYVAADEGYDDHELYDFSRYRGLQLVCPIKRYRHTKSERLELIHFYKSKLGQHVYSCRSVSVEPLIEHIKDVFDIDPLPGRGFDNARSIVLLSVLLYQIMVYYNHLTRRPLRALKHMLGS
jgi:hypothetical protein